MDEDKTGGPAIKFTDKPKDPFMKKANEALSIMHLAIVRLAEKAKREASNG